MLIRLTVEPSEGLPHHVEFCPAGALADTGVALAQHLAHEMIRHAARTEPGCKGMAKFVQRKIRDARPLERRGPRFSQVRNVRLLALLPRAREQILGLGRLLDLL